MNVHKTTIHTRCPYLPVWDYYEVTVSTGTFLQCEAVEAAADKARGQTITQESVAEILREELPDVDQVKVVGRHGANCLLEVTL